MDIGINEMRSFKIPSSENLMPAIEWVAEQIPGGFFIYRADETLEMLYVNSATVRMFGCKTVDEFKELTGYTFKGLTTTVTLPIFRATATYTMSS